MVKKKIKTIEKFDKKTAVFEDSENEIQNRLDMENQKLSCLAQNFREIEKYGDVKSFQTMSINVTMKVV